MKILLINDTTQKIGGAEEHCYSLKSLLESKGHKVKLFGKSSFEALPSYLLRFFDPIVYLQTIKLIKDFNPDIIHIHEVIRNISPSPIVAAKVMGKKTIMSIHDYQLYCPKSWAIYQDGKPCPYGFSIRCLYSNCITNERGFRYFPYHFIKWIKVGLHRQLVKNNVDRFIVASSKLGDLIQFSLRISEKKIFNLPHFTISKLTRKRNMTDIKSGQFLYVGRLSKEKGVDVLIHAMDVLVQKGIINTKLNVVGDGPERNRLEKLTKQLNLGNYIYFLGKLSRSKISKYYLESLAVIIPSVCMEVGPLVAYEAMSYGTAIIASNIGSLPEHVKDSKNGFLFEKGNSRMLAFLLNKLNGNIKLCKDLGDEGRLIAKARFNKDLYYNNLMNIYKSL